MSVLEIDREDALHVCDNLKQDWYHANWHLSCTTVISPKPKEKQVKTTKDRTTLKKNRYPDEEAFDVGKWPKFDQSDKDERLHLFHRGIRIPGTAMKDPENKLKIRIRQQTTELVERFSYL